MNTFQILLIVSLALQLLLICYSDIRHRIISNRFVMTTAINTLALGFLTYNTVSIVIPLLALLTGYILFYFNYIGGGDVKLISALLFALNIEQSLDFIIYTAIMGGVVMLIGLLINKKDIQQRGVPYAVAISSGFLLSLFL
ncbi:MULTISPECIES: prepilin peptidase [Yersinia]|uniref:A24 family peptidase n=1 Tax=Yersinia TaxID=629 RepID=UPI0005DFA208|nr:MULTISPECIES: prepilin peptidase [Yersinia]OVZ98578.1 tight adherance operon protein [Yersinia frederiksenii]RXA97204.1 tight adherance operon protein [Yersinia sp. 2105 StPb PI]CNI47046.1 putative tight adherance operon protein [Yersinia frederiksenii]